MRMTGLSQKDWIVNLENAYRDACEAAGKEAADFVLMRYDAKSIYSLNSCYYCDVFNGLTALFDDA